MIAVDLRGHGASSRGPYSADNLTETLPHNLNLVIGHSLGNPDWTTTDLDIELATLADWDPDTTHAVLGPNALDRTPTHPIVPSLVLTADPSPLVSPALATRLKEQGFEVRPVTGTGHTIHRDNHDAFMKSLDGWI